MTETKKTIAFFGASTRAISFLERLIELRPGDEIIVFSFREDPWEPPFFDQLNEIANSSGNEFVNMKSIGPRKLAEVLGDRTLDVMFAVGWRYLIPPSVYEQTTSASVVFHDSLLPAYRGFAPTNWAIINGETESGATMFIMSETVDSGPIIDQEKIVIGPDETISEVAEKVTAAYLALLEKNVDGLLSGEFSVSPQDEALATLTTKRVPADGEIDWSGSSASIHNLVRALSAPWPGAYTTLKGERLMIWSTSRYVGSRIVGSVPGRVVDLSQKPLVTVATGDGAIVVRTVQLEGADVVGASEAIKSVSDTLGR